MAQVCSPASGAGGMVILTEKAWLLLTELQVLDLEAVVQMTACGARPSKVSFSSGELAVETWEAQEP